MHSNCLKLPLSHCKGEEGLLKDKIKMKLSSKFLVCNHLENAYNIEYVIFYITRCNNTAYSVEKNLLLG